MRVLWLSNIIFPEAKALLEKKDVPLASTGGWLIGAAHELSSRDGIDLHIACPYSVKEIVSLKGERLTYHLFPGLQRSGDPFMGNCPALDATLKSIVDTVQPDLVDIHGTEYAQHLSCLRVCQGIKTVVTIQGILYIYAQNYYRGLSKADILLHLKPFGRTIFQEAHSFYRRGEVEKTLMRQTPCFIGRTAWDKASAAEMNPNAAYFHCEETMREPFYSGRWEYSACEPHRIFVSQATYPVKGLHQLLRALPAVLSAFPNTMVYVGGCNILAGKKKHWGNYARIIGALIKRLHLDKHVVFTGNLDAQGMKEQLLKANVFVSPSTIENSPNSLAEAQLLGVPCVASEVGGVPTMIPSPEYGSLYPFDNTDELARLICQTFTDSPRWDNTPVREMARERHDPQKNCNRLIDIYRTVLQP